MPSTVYDQDEHQDEPTEEHDVEGDFGDEGAGPDPDEEPAE